MRVFAGTAFQGEEEYAARHLVGKWSPSWRRGRPEPLDGTLDALVGLKGGRVGPRQG